MLGVAVFFVCNAVASAFRTFSMCSSVPIIIRDATGRVTSPNFPNQYKPSLDCKWNIRARTGIKLTMEYLDNSEFFDGGSISCYDQLQITSIDSKGDPNYIHAENELCARNVNDLRNKVFRVSKDKNGLANVKISFSSDYATQGTGFSLYFEALCNETQKAKSGTIMSPGYPQNYPNYANCFTDIHGPFGSNIEIKFTSMELTKSDECDTDYVVVSEGPPGAYGTKHTRYCKSNLKTILVKSAVATLQFVSDGNLTNSGFVAKWHAVLPTTPSPKISSTTVEVSTEKALTTASTFTTFTSSTKIDESERNCSYTKDGKQCDRWDKSFPHKNNSHPAYPINGSHNFCRNVGNKAGPWCYTIDPQTPWEYCDLDNCVEATTKYEKPRLSVTTQRSQYFIETSDSFTPDGGEYNVTTLDSTPLKSAEVLWYPIVAVCALVIIIVLLLLFWWRGTNRKTAVTISEPIASDTVAFHQFDYDEDHQRPRENTYVEIPYFDDSRGNNRDNQENCEKGFAHANNYHENGGSSRTSVDSVQFAKDAASRIQQRGASTFSDITAYSVADDVHNLQEAAAGAPSPSLAMGSFSQNATKPHNVYQAIDESPKTEDNFGLEFRPVEIPATILTQLDGATTLPSSATGQEDAQSKMPDSRKIKSKEWKYLKKPFGSEQKAKLEFSNPFYKKEYDRDTDADKDNLFECHDFGHAIKTQQSDITPVATSGNYDSEMPIDANLYSAPSLIPKSTSTLKLVQESEQTGTKGADPPYMVPRLSKLKKLLHEGELVCISPTIIDDDSDQTASAFAMDRHTLAPDPTSPVFDLSENFTYDDPRQHFAAANLLSGKKSDTSSRIESDDSRAIDIRPSNIVCDDGPDRDEKSTEYCVMEDVGIKSSRNSEVCECDPKATNRLSQLYLSMKGVDLHDRRVSESSYKTPTVVPFNSRKSL